jgi:prepilin-type processing-associated H-X9-DG protein
MPSVGRTTVYPINKLTAPAYTVLAFEVRKTTCQFTLADEGKSNGNNTNCPVGNGLSLYTVNPSQSARGLAGVWTIQYATGYFAGRVYNTSAVETGAPSYLPADPDNPTHVAGSNFIMCDGHAKWASPSTVSSGFFAVNITDAQDACTSSNKVNGTPCAAGTGNLTGPNGLTFAITFSPN